MHVLRGHRSCVKSELKFSAVQLNMQPFSRWTCMCLLTHEPPYTYMPVCFEIHVNCVCNWSSVRLGGAINVAACTWLLHANHAVRNVQLTSIDANVRTKNR
eukprot:GDKI01039739.1.p1 GENE.GDKI01039739.1~~GDKI01039739.1.p1  ORF type:complete len:101 (-),score=4.78 GDKI01039739.1:25-327(-)